MAVWMGSARRGGMAVLVALMLAMPACSSAPGPASAVPGSAPQAPTSAPNGTPAAAALDFGGVTLDGDQLVAATLAGTPARPPTR